MNLSFHSRKKLCLEKKNVFYVFVCLLLGTSSLCPVTAWELAHIYQLLKCTARDIDIHPHDLRVDTFLVTEMFAYNIKKKKELPLPCRSINIFFFFFFQPHFIWFLKALLFLIF